MNKINSKLNFTQIEKKLNLADDFAPTSYKTWKEKVVQDLKGVDFSEKLKFMSYEGLELEPIYTKNDLKNLAITDNQSGFSSLLTHVQDRHWEIAQSINTDSPEKYNTLLNSGLKNGQTTILLSESENKIEKCNSEQFNLFFKNIDLTKYLVNIFCGYSAKDVLQKFENLLQQKNISYGDINVAIFSSPIAHLAAQGFLPNSIEDTFNELNTVTNLLHQKKAKIHSILVDASIYNNAGSNAVQDLAFSIASGSEYIYRLSELGSDVNQIASQISFKFGIGSFFFMEIAKLRAARILWSRVLEVYGVNVENRKMHIFAQTSRYNQTTLDIHNNILRGTTEAFSAVVGGADVIDVIPFDTHVKEANEFSIHLSRNIQNILKEESHLDKVVDAGGGSYFIEKLTEELCKKAWELFQQVEESGGIIEALKSNFIQDSIEKTNRMKLNDFTEKKNVIVGVNKYKNEKERISAGEFEKRILEIDNNLNNSVYKFKVKPILAIRAAAQFEN